MERKSEDSMPRTYVLMLRFLLITILCSLFAFSPSAETVMRSPRLISPRIADFSSALHNHSNAANGGQLNLTAIVSGILPGVNGGTGNGFFAVSGPASSLKTFTFPNASATVLTTNATVTVAQGGTGITSGTSGGIPYFSGSTTIASSSALTANSPVIGGGVGSAPSVGSRSGNTTTFATTSGSLTSGNCAKFDASGNIVDHGSTCGGGGSLTVKEVDNSPSVSSVATIRVSNATLTDDGGGQVTITTSGGGSGDSTHTAAYGSRPSPSNAGDLFFPSNGFVVERDTGAVWSPWGPIFPFTAPVDSDFSWLNQGTASVVTTNGGIHMAIPAAAATTRARVKSVTPPYKITAWFISMPDPAGNSNIGLGFRQSSDGKNHVIVLGPVIASQKQDAFVFNANYTFTAVAAGVSFLGVPICVQIEDDNTNRIVRYGFDGINFVTYHSIGRTDFLTADQVYWWGNSNATFNAGVTLMSWKQE